MPLLPCSPRPGPRLLRALAKPPLVLVPCQLPPLLLSATREAEKKKAKKGGMTISQRRPSLPRLKSRLQPRRR